MKRSDMVKLIVDSIEFHNGNDPSWLEQPSMRRQKEQAYDVASKLLSDIEKAGMMPPKYSKEIKHKNEKQLQIEFIQDWE